MNTFQSQCSVEIGKTRLRMVRLYVPCWGYSPPMVQRGVCGKTVCDILCVVRMGTSTQNMSCMLCLQSKVSTLLSEPRDKGNVREVKASPEKLSGLYC
eukprot:1500678-Amphidinium_carterae.1